jgi:hypothetical protein
MSATSTTGGASAAGAVGSTSIFSTICPFRAVCGRSWAALREAEAEENVYSPPFFLFLAFFERGELEPGTAHEYVCPSKTLPLSRFIPAHRSDRMTARIPLLLLLSTACSTAFRFPTFKWPTAPSNSASEENGVDDAFPWRFDGRVWFQPALTRAPAAIPGDVSPIAVFGWTLGGTVCLEYDESPVGPYREYVTMGSLATKRGAVGQLGSRLHVSTKEAEEVCQRVWAVPAEVAKLHFAEEGDLLSVDAPPGRSASEDAVSPPRISVSGWAATRSAAAGSERRGGLPILWTPSIKALWAPVVPLSAPPAPGQLPLHDLRLSASSLRLCRCATRSHDESTIPLPIGLSVDGLRIEISREKSEAL